MLHRDAVIRAVEALSRRGVPYMLTGSTVSSLQGAPRSTHDIDLVVELSWRDFHAILEEFAEPHYELNEAAARSVMNRPQQDSMFTALDTVTGFKLDFWLLSEDGFDVSRFARKREIDWGGHRIVVSAPEDTVLQKLRWARASGGSARQSDDARRVLQVHAGAIDDSYLDRWAGRLGVTTELAQIRTAIGAGGVTPPPASQ